MLCELKGVVCECRIFNQTGCLISHGDKDSLGCIPLVARVYRPEGRKRVEHTTGGRVNPDFVSVDFWTIAMQGVGSGVGRRQSRYAATWLHDQLLFFDGMHRIRIRLRRDRGGI